ncbi:MAG TPA: hypothetical protein VK203_17720 [Nostocaceae cyanobacterium]|nr:hypothetical protein [Nostocaceae cyanobacterium]
MNNKRILTCTFLALTSGFFGALIGGQTAVFVHSQKCQNQPWLFKEMCTTAVTPGAMWQGTTTGVWMGITLGAFVGGIATKESY